MKIRVYQDRPYVGNWVAWCEGHDEAIWADSWEAAYEAAAGHAVMHHPRSA